MDPVKQEQDQTQPENENPGLREMINRYPGLQAQIDHIVEERLHRERAGFEKKLAEEVDERTAKLQAQVEKLSAPQNDDVQKAVQKVREETTAEREAWQQQAKSWEERFKKGQAERMLLEAAVKRGAYRPRQVVDLLANKVQWEDGEDGPVPVLKLDDESGQVVGAYAGAELGKGVAAYLAANPNLVAAGSGPGAGGRPGVPSLPLTAEAMRGLGVEQLRKLRPELERLANSMGR